MIDTQEYLFFVERAFDGMLEAVRELGSERANMRPSAVGTNSPMAIVHHCTVVADYWIGHLLAGRAVDRDRESEFTTIRPISTLTGEVVTLLARLAQDLENVDLDAPPLDLPPHEYQGPDRSLTAHGVLLHVLEELAQHHGQVQISRDILLRGDVR